MTTRSPQPPHCGKLSAAEQALLDSLLSRDLPEESEYPQLAKVISEAFRSFDEEQEWRHWTQHMLGTVKMSLAKSDFERARDLVSHYWPKALAYKETANGSNTSERELWEQVAAGQLNEKLLVEHRERLIMLLVGLDKERAIRQTRQLRLEQLVAAIESSDEVRATEALERIDGSRHFDEEAFAWATEFYRHTNPSGA